MIRIKAALFCLGLVAASIAASAQGNSISGTIVDKIDNSALVGVVVKLSGMDNATVTNENGRFVLSGVIDGEYTLSASYIGYNQLDKTVVVNGKDIVLGTIKLVVAPTSLSEAVITETQSRVELKGDTTQFNAEAYKTNPDATVSDLVKKMPGVTYDANGNVQVNGESVKKVLVDGKEFFGNDPNTSMKNLPASIVSKVQVFDNLSEQAQFTGFSDGTNNVALNIITKDGMTEGQFGKIYGGYGTDDRYQAGFNLNFFKGDRRVSLLGMSNNINQQNFSTSDIMGLMSGSGGGRGGMRNRNNGGLDIGNLLFGQNNSGNTIVNSGGINYIDQLGEKLKVTGSYFYNQTDNTNNAELIRNYFTETPQEYKEQSLTETTNINHRVNLRLEYQIDKNNSVVYTPSLTLQENKSSTSLNGNTAVNNADVISSTENSQSSDRNGYSTGNNLLYRHKFNKKGRTISVGVDADFSGNEGTGSYYSLTTSDTRSQLLDQQYTTESSTESYGATIAYTEPVGTKGQLMLEYKPSVNNNDVDKTTMDVDAATGDYTSFNSSLSNKYTSTYATQRGGATYSLNTGKARISIGADVQSATLTGEQVYPQGGEVRKEFLNVLPNVSLNFSKSKSRSFRLMYRTSTTAPSITDLQNVVDVSNPLLLTTGNPDLEQSYQHSLSLHYRSVDMGSSRMFFTGLRGSYTNDYMTSQTIIPAADTVVNNTTVSRGSQITLPVNVDGYYNLRTFAVYGLPIPLLKSNVNISSGVTYTRTPSLLNNETNISNNTAFNFRTYIGSNISEKVDFNISYNGSYNLVNNSLQQEANNNYFTHTATVGANFILGNRVVLNTDYNFTAYNGLTDSYNQSFHLWNAYVGYKFLKNRQLEAKISVFDILNQNTDISRTVTQAYTQDNQSTVLQQYFMLTLTYNLMNFTKGSMPEHTGPPAGMPPPPRMNR